MIIGKKIPAGTGLIHSEDTIVGSQAEYDRLMELKEDEKDLSTSNLVEHNLDEVSKDK